jgi:predicted nucleic acid-binding protein
MIVDASVAFKWIVLEADSDVARPLLTRTDLMAPAIINVEIGYVLTKRVRQRSLSQDLARTAWRDLASYPVVLVDDAPLLDTAFGLSLNLGAAFYDCVYLAQAVRDDDVVITADERFIQAVRSAPGVGRRVKSLAETLS